MVNKKVKRLIVILLLSLSTINMSCEKAQKANSNKTEVYKINEHNKEKEELKDIKIEDISKLFSNDKYGFVFEEIELDNKEIHYIGKCKDPECFGLLDLSGNGNLNFLKYSMALSEDENINNNSFNNMLDLAKIICPSFIDFSTWVEESKENIRNSKSLNSKEASYNGFNISFGLDENTGALALKITKKSN